MTIFPYDVNVFCLNPEAVANYKKSFTGLDKNDISASFIITDYTFELWRGAQYLASQCLTRHCEHISKSFAREKLYPK